MLIMRQYLLCTQFFIASVGSEYTILGTKSSIASTLMPQPTFKDQLLSPYTSLPIPTIILLVRPCSAEYGTVVRQKSHGEGRFGSFLITFLAKGLTLCQVEIYQFLQIAKILHGRFPTLRQL